jgi:hypothetical protein
MTVNSIHILSSHCLLGGQSASLGTVQQDAGRNVTGQLSPNSALNVDNVWHVQKPFPSNSFFKQSTVAAHVWINAGTLYNHTEGLDVDASRCWGASHTAAEFRPQNVAVLYCIKHD